MKTLIAVTILSMVAGSPAFGCSDKAPARWVRVQFAPGCPVPDDSILVQVGTKTKVATKQGGYYIADFDPDRFNAGYELTVNVPAGMAFCCHSAVENPHPVNRRDCTVDYIVSCDKPSWGLVASSDSQSIDFEYSREHPGLKTFLCQREIKSLSGIAGLGDLDTVMVKVKQGDQAIVSIPVTRQTLKAHKGKLPFDRKALEESFPTGKGVRNGGTNETEFIDLVKVKLPDKVIVTEIR